MSRTKEKRIRKRRKPYSESYAIPQDDRQLVARIKTLHALFENSYRQTTESAAEIGKLLIDKKKGLKHGEWLPWLNANLPFSDRTARNYITIYRNIEKLKLENCSNIHKALTQLKDPVNSQRTDDRERIKNYRKAFADLNLPYKNPPKGQYLNKIIHGNNLEVLPEMLEHGMGGKYDMILVSPPYNADFYYSANHNDSKTPQEYFDELVKPFKYYPQLLVPGGRIVYVLGNYIPNPDRDKGGDYIYDIPYELRKRVEFVAPSLRYYGNVIWNKGDKGKCPLKNNWGTFKSPKEPVNVAVHEQILVWSNKEFSLKKPDGGSIDITEDEFKEFAFSVWDVGPYVAPYNPHPASFSPKLVERILKFWAYQNSNILDCYHGAGITAKVCKELHRNFTGVELNNNYCVYAQALLKSENFKVGKRAMQEMLKDHKDVLKMIGL